MLSIGEVVGGLIKFLTFTLISLEVVAVTLILKVKVLAVVVHWSIVTPNEGNTRVH